MTTNNESKSCARCGKTISANKTTCAACLAAPQPPRSDAETSPLKISFFAGSPHAPDDVKQYVAALNEYSPVPEHCVLLPWRDAFAVLIRADKTWFHFQPNDADWQVNGWLMVREELFPPSPLTD